MCVSVGGGGGGGGWGDGASATCMFWPTHSPASSDHLCQLVRKFISIRDLMSVIYSQCNVNGCNAKT